MATSPPLGSTHPRLLAGRDRRERERSGCWPARSAQPSLEPSTLESPQMRERLGTGKDRTALRGSLASSACRRASRGRAFARSERAERGSGRGSPACATAAQALADVAGQAAHVDALRAVDRPRCESGLDRLDVSSSGSTTTGAARARAPPPGGPARTSDGRPS